MTDRIDIVMRAHTQLDAWRARGDDAMDRMRFRVIEALARRASSHEGEARRVLDARLSSLLDDYARDVERAGASVEPESRALESPFAGLLQALSERAANHAVPAELLDYLRGVWSKVSAEKRVRESLAQVPKNAGPLNSSSLVHRLLAVMQDVSPEYLQYFLGYLDSLAWLEEMAWPQREAPRAVVAKKTRRGKAR
ncbi:hypothetical protein BVER_01447 [Candidatus Burkholderia verschuerenii]|uniref:DUF2894 domain-containing protein n=1 Tax=Candidatus Burkholderia verschuerenii TaxID=242163 RepID=A0A0L0MI14_9BURK|nr:DUF2894 domain-containing protein [Candidatus Burkholderia verschuerenii]KND61958.1 hypothetical protein BVER_01447 [Candidatus Burkholderia verschuerenii]